MIDEVDRNFFGAHAESRTKSGGGSPANRQRLSTAAVSGCRSSPLAGEVERLSPPIPEDACLTVDGPLVPFVLRRVQLPPMRIPAEEAIRLSFVINQIDRPVDAQFGGQLESWSGGRRRQPASCREGRDGRGSRGSPRVGLNQRPRRCRSHLTRACAVRRNPFIPCDVRHRCPPRRVCRLGRSDA